MAGLYIHIPFCKQACYYCDFHFSTNKTYQAEMIQALLTELQLQRDYLNGEPVETVYFGGGTPSVLAASQLKEVLDTVRSCCYVRDGAEVTLEANPDDLTPVKLPALREIGINRLSIGIQSFDDQILRFLNRAHDAGMALTCVDEARKAGFSNISIDLIYAIPGQPETILRDNLARAIDLQPEHISAYSLTIEDKTVFGRRAAKAKMPLVSDDAAAFQMEVLMDTLEKNGYEHYEISNFCKPGFQSKHNTSYWQQKKYLGIGPSAHSFDGHSRQHNIANNHLYIQSLRQSKVPFEREILSFEDKINEYLLTSLRTLSGCDMEKLRIEMGLDLEKTHENYIRDLIKNKLALVENGRMRLTKAGRLLADKISSDLFVITRQ